jgi:hypothetical protein
MTGMETKLNFLQGPTHVTIYAPDKYFNGQIKSEYTTPMVSMSFVSNLIISRVNSEDNTRESSIYHNSSSQRYLIYLSEICRFLIV